MYSVNRAGEGETKEGRGVRLEIVKIGDEKFTTVLGVI
jgi:hypothetical protein